MNRATDNKYENKLLSTIPMNAKTILRKSKIENEKIVEWRQIVWFVVINYVRWHSKERLETSVEIWLQNSLIYEKYIVNDLDNCLWEIFQEKIPNWVNLFIYFFSFHGSLEPKSRINCNDFFNKRKNWLFL